MLANFLKYPVIASNEIQFNVNVIAITYYYSHNTLSIALLHYFVHILK